MASELVYASRTSEPQIQFHIYKESEWKSYSWGFTTFDGKTKGIQRQAQRGGDQESVGRRVVLAMTVAERNCTDSDENLY
ncbi:Hypothetical predicted protein [Olea europaea subsp. europaea]|uniref:Uncharacterized protein n=1 Tax=Olea europaea subsp. europaea TaxID=158383 RepID=A0A8S0PSP9_OLEEU|nr:Hypothetical predicted protein [Olea europaea subsp. europaea]